MNPMKKVLLTTALLLTPVTALAQTDAATTPATTGTSDATNTNDRGFDYGWLGLLGLLGLAGLRRPAPQVVDRSAPHRP